VREAHQRDRSQHEHHSQLEHQDGVEEIEHLRRFVLGRTEGQEDQQGEAHGQHVRGE